MGGFEDLVAELDGRMTIYPPNDPAEVEAALQAVGNAPPELAEIYRRTSGISMRRINFHDLELLVQEARERPDSMRWSVQFAGDGGSGAFFVDTTDHLGEGVGAVFWGHIGETSPADLTPCAPSIAAFLRVVAAGEEPWYGPTVRERRIARMNQAFAANPRAWQGQRGVKRLDLRDDDARRVGVGFPPELEALYEVTDGAILPVAGVTIVPRAKLTAVPGTEVEGRPRLVEFAVGVDRSVYAVTVLGWRDPDGGLVVRLREGDDPATAPPLGPLPDVVVAWLERKAR